MSSISRPTHSTFHSRQSKAVEKQTSQAQHIPAPKDKALHSQVWQLRVQSVIEAELKEGKDQSMKGICFAVYFNTIIAG